MKELADMTEPELRHLTNQIMQGIMRKLPPNTMACVLFSPFGEHDICQYGANAERADMIKMLRETADRLENRQDVPR